MNSLSNLFNFQGTTHFGGPVAEKLAVSTAVQQQSTLGSSAVVIGGVKPAQSPAVGLEGKVIQAPQGMKPSSSFHVGWNTDGVSDAIVKAIVFDAKGNAAAAGISNDGVTTAGTLYSKTNNATGIAKYDALVSRLCSSSYTIGVIRFKIRRSASASVDPSLDDVSMEISWVDENFDTQKRTIDLVNHSSADSYHRDQIDLALTDSAMLLDQSTVVKITGPQDAILDMIWFPTSRS